MDIEVDIGDVRLNCDQLLAIGARDAEKRCEI